MTQNPDLTFQSATYDKADNVATAKDANGNVVRNSYDELNRLTSVTFPNSTQLQYFYDGNGNLVKMTYPVQPAQGATDSTTYSYDARNRLTGETQTVDGKAYSLAYSYDGAGNVISMKYPDGYSVTMTYDALNRLHRLGTLATVYYTLDNQVASIRYGDGKTSTYT